MSVTAPGPDELRRMARLTALEISDRDLPDTMRDIERILGFVAAITDVDLTGPDTVGPHEGSPISLPPDDVGASLTPPIDLTGFAPQLHDGLILCPPVPHQVLPPE